MAESLRQLQARIARQQAPGPELEDLLSRASELAGQVIDPGCAELRRRAGELLARSRDNTVRAIQWPRLLQSWSQEGSWQKCDAVLRPFVRFGYSGNEEDGRMTPAEFDEYLAGNLRRDAVSASPTPMVDEAAAQPEHRGDDFDDEEEGHAHEKALEDSYDEAVGQLVDARLQGGPADESVRSAKLALLSVADQAAVGRDAVLCDAVGKAALAALRKLERRVPDVAGALAELIGRDPARERARYAACWASRLGDGSKEPEQDEEPHRPQMPRVGAGGNETFWEPPALGGWTVSPLMIGAS